MPDRVNAQDPSFHEDVAHPTIGLRGYRVLDTARAEERRLGIIGAAARVFSRKSYYAATMDDVAQELGVTKGVVYYNFRSKEEVLLEILVGAISEALRRLQNADERSGPPDQKLRTALRQLIRYNLDEATTNYYAMLVIGDTKALSPENRPKVRELQHQYQRIVIRMIEDGCAAGVFDVPNASIAAMNILTGANGVSNWYRSGRAADPDEVADQVSEQLVRGISRPPC